jgi:LacI family transcriptional regulator
MKDIAQHCGVGPTTVQRALSGATRIAPETAERIRAVARQLGYNPTEQNGARRLAYQRHGKQIINRVVALHFPPTYLDSPYFSRLFRGIFTGLSREEFDVLFTHSRFVIEEELPRSLLHAEVDGLLATTGQYKLRAMVDQLRAMPSFGRRPIISLMQPIDGASSVCADDLGGGYAAAAHLLDLGHRHLIFFANEFKQMIGYPVFGYHAFQRSAGYRKAFQERGLNPDECLHFRSLGILALSDEREQATVPLTYKMAQMAPPLLAALREHPEITGVLAPNDQYALQAIDALVQEGYRVPEDISVVGFDDTDPWLDGQQQNQLTTITLPLEALGEQAAALIINQILHNATRNISITLPVSLTIRGSTGPHHA